MTSDRLILRCRIAPANASLLRRELTGLAILALALACQRNPAQRSDALGTAPAQRLVGVWDATFWLDRPVDVLPGSSFKPLRITGTIAFVEDHAGRLSPEALPEPTHLGIYDIDFRPLGFEPRTAAGFPVAVARTSAGVNPQTDPTAPARIDSVSIAFDPGSSVYPLRVLGTITLDSVSGQWTAGQSLSGGGRFVLLRHSRRAVIASDGRPARTFVAAQR